MRKLTAGTFVVLLIMSISACNDSTTPAPTPQSTSNATATTEIPTATPSPAATEAATMLASAFPIATSEETPSPTATTVPATSASPAAESKTNVLDLHALPLGDGKVSTSADSGYVFSCQTNFKRAARSTPAPGFTVTPGI